MGAGRLDGKVALISGAARGMGAEEARLFVAEGARVVIGDVLEGELKQLAAELGDAALAVHLDVTEEDEWTAAVASTVATFGRLDVLINNAGILGIPLPLAMTPVDQYRRVIEVNQVGVFLGMKSVVGAMADSGGGSIINISSIDGLLGQTAMIPYVSSKFAVRGMTKTAAQELGMLGIRVNSVHPGYIDTQMLSPDNVGIDLKAMFHFDNVPAGRVGQPDDVAKVVLFLASDDSAYCTGSEFVVDGGLTSGVPIPPAP